jgi:hypothetical protein
MNWTKLPLSAVELESAFEKPLCRDSRCDGTAVSPEDVGIFLFTRAHKRTASG